jgi:hypothetical protein
MSEQVEIIKQYLRIETNYAVIINGQYGVGKTHFYKNELSIKIKEVSLAKDDKKTFTPIHVSLFGVKSLEEIQTAIFLELYPILNNKKLKLATGICKSIVRGIAQIKGFENIDHYIGDIEQDVNNWLNYDELVICFDDLDRKSGCLDLLEVFGFINSLVENQGAKIIIIANDEKLRIDENYTLSLKEKVIGISIRYEPDVESVFKQIIDSKYLSSSNIFHSFLQEKSSRIVEIIKLNQNNFRNLIFFLEHFRTVFNLLEIEFQEDRDFRLLKEEKLQSVLDFTIAITIEYKLGLINSSNFEQVKELNILPPIKFDFTLIKQKINNEENDDKTSNYIETFRNKYFLNKKYYYFKSIFDYVTGIKSFCIKTLKSELMDYFIIKNGEIPEQDKVLNDLSFFGCLTLSDANYKRLTSKMLEFVDKGKYQLKEYPTIFHYITRFNNLLGYNIKILKKRFKKGIKKGFSNYNYDHHYRFHMFISSDFEFKEDVLEISNYCLEINNTLQKKNKISEFKELFVLFQNDYDSFIEKVLEHDSYLRISPFWLEFNLKKVVNIIEKLENDKIWNLGHYFNDRYQVHFNEMIEPEKDFVIKLREALNRPVKKRKTKNLKNACLNFLSQTLIESEKNFQK